MSIFSQIMHTVTDFALAPAKAVIGALSPQPSAPAAAPAATDNSKLLQQQIDLQKKQITDAQQATSTAQRNAAIQAQDTSAQQAMNQANTGAQQALGQQTAYQQALDAANVASAKSAAAGAGASQMGAGVAAASGPQGKGAMAIPSMTVAGGGGGAMGGTAAKPTSSFTLPDTSGLKFGGS